MSNTGLSMKGRDMSRTRFRSWLFFTVALRTAPATVLADPAAAGDGRPYTIR
jgi:hypothetical protein